MEAEMVRQDPKILIIDDEQEVCDILSEGLHEHGYLCCTAGDANGALTRLASDVFDVVLLDIKLPDISGMELLPKIQASYPNTNTIIITAVNDVDTAVEAMKRGASDYVIKPFKLDAVDNSVRKAMEFKPGLSERTKNDPQPHLGSEGEDNTNSEEWYREINDIAHGVEARWESIFNFSQLVTERTIAIAQQLGIPDTVIQRWAAMRSRSIANRDAAIESSRGKLTQTPLAQIIMNVAVPYTYTPEPGESHN